MSIGYNGLGNNGRLGNQMFQYAALRGIAAHRGFDFMFPPPYNSVDNYAIHDCFKLTNVSDRNIGFHPSEQYAQEGQFHFNEGLYNELPDGVNLYGFYQTMRYWQDIENDIRQDFEFKKGILEPCKEMMESFDQHPIMLHVRRGDPNLADKRGFKWAYVNLQDQHPVQTLEYYEKALSKFDANVPVIVFSDSIDWCKEQEFFSDDRFNFSESTEQHEDGALVPFVDLCLMSLCDGGITANSSLSWWGGFLQQERTRPLVSPVNWFGPAYANHDTKDLIPSNRDWIRL